MNRTLWSEPLVLPLGWRIWDRTEGEDGYGTRYMHTDGRILIASVSVEADGRHWLHVSVSQRSRLPSWEELREAKDVWVGRDRIAYQVLPRAEDHVNIHPHVLHLWAPLEGDDPLPLFNRDARRGGEI